MTDTLDGKTAQFGAAVLNALPRDMTKATIDRWLGDSTGLKNVLRNTFCPPPQSGIVDCDAQPFVPEGWTVEEHKKMGQMKLKKKGEELFLNGQKLVFLSKRQVKGKSIVGHELRKELGNETVLNANVLDHLLAHPELIPDSWKKDAEDNYRYIFFWGTIYRYSDGGLCVRFLDWFGGEWCWDYYWLGGGWSVGDPAAVLAS